MKAMTSPTLAVIADGVERQVLDRHGHGARRPRTARTGGRQRPTRPAPMPLCWERVVAAPPPHAASASIENRPTAADARRIMVTSQSPAAGCRVSRLMVRTPRGRFGRRLRYRRDRYRCPMAGTDVALHGVDEPTMRRLLIHEARVHALPGREVRDLGDAILLIDPIDPEPFWNRRRPSAGRLTRRPSIGASAELLILFTALVRQPHIWPAPAHDTPTDLVARLEANGFRDVGAEPGHGRWSIAAKARDRASLRLPPGIRLERLHGLAGRGRTPGGDRHRVRAARRVRRRAGPARRRSRRRRWRRSGTRAFTYYLLRLDGNPAAVARRATFDGASYLSSIGTATWARGGASVGR